MSLTPFHMCCPFTHRVICRCHQRQMKNYQQEAHARREHAASATLAYQVFTKAFPDFESHFDATNGVHILHDIAVPAQFIKQHLPQQQQPQQQEPIAMINTSNMTTRQYNSLKNATNMASAIKSRPIPQTPTTTTTQQRSPAAMQQPMTPVHQSTPTTASTPQQQAATPMFRNPFMPFAAPAGTPSQFSQSQWNMMFSTINNMMTSPAASQPMMSPNFYPGSSPNIAGKIPAASPQNSMMPWMFSKPAPTPTATVPQHPFLQEEKREKRKYKKKDRCHECKGKDRTQEMLHCTACKRMVHADCHDPNLSHMRPEYRAIWTCEDCKKCEICGKAGKEEFLLFCEHCDRGYHTFCLKPPLDDIPEGSWVCASCEKDKLLAPVPTVVATTTTTTNTTPASSKKRPRKEKNLPLRKRRKTSKNDE